LSRSFFTLCWNTLFTSSLLYLSSLLIHIRFFPLQTNMKFYTTAGAVLLTTFAATAGGIEFDPENEGTKLPYSWIYQAGRL
jgi:hypothetical protein